MKATGIIRWLQESREIEVLEDQLKSRIFGGAGENERTELTQERLACAGTAQYHCTSVQTRRR